MPATDGSSLLQLPGELRNKVYEYVLTEPSKILSWNHGQSNQLRLVCRQLHTETNWLELRCNIPITFVQRESAHPGPAQQFNAFTKALPTPALQWLCTVVLNNLSAINGADTEPRLEYDWISLNDPQQRLPFMPETVTALVELSDVCRALPQMQLRYILPGFTLEIDRPCAVLYFILKGLFYSKVLRGYYVPEPKRWTAWRGSMLFYWMTILTDSASDWFRIIPSGKTEEEKLLIERQHLQTMQEQLMSAEETEAMLQDVRKMANYRVWDEALAKLQAPNLKFCASPTHIEDGSFLGMLQDALTESATASELVSDVLATGLHDVWERQARKWMDTGI
jgi:hypothetical protein